MKNWNKNIPLIVIFTLISTMLCAANAQETCLFPEWSGSLNGGYESTPLYRGIDCAAERLSASITATVGANIGIWYD